MTLVANSALLRTPDSSGSGGPARPARFVLWFLWLAFVCAICSAWQPAHAAEEFLEPEKAFQFSARPLDAKTVAVTFDIAPGYYLYREQFRFAADGATLGTVQLPPGKVKFDDTFQKNVETYRRAVTVNVPVESASSRFRLITTSQGCADAGLCYPPQQSLADVSLAGFGGNGSVGPVDAAEVTSSRTGSVLGSAVSTAPGTSGLSAVTTGFGRPATQADGELGAIESVLHGGAFWSVVGAFFVAGLLLSLTPCVLPMLPIVSSIIVGQGGYASGAAAAPVVGAGRREAERPSRSRGLALAALYSLGMAVVYTAFGVAAGLAGEGLAAALQNPWVLGAFALILVALALSMFGVYELQMPAALAGRFTDAAQRLPAGRATGVFAMGGVSALIVSPCVAAPLAGALLYLSQTKDVWLGGTALFSLSAGMSVPLLLVGASAGALLPRAGAWMEEVKCVFGVLLLGVALWTVQPVLPASLALALWGVLALGSAALVLARRSSATTGPTAEPASPLAASPLAPQRAWRTAIAGLLALVGALEIVGAAAGGTDALQPLAVFSSRPGSSMLADGANFRPIKGASGLDTALRTSGRPVMLDFYADWCVSCKEMDKFTFADPAVQQRLKGALLLRADVTANDPQDRELLRRFRLFGPPATLFFDARGNEIGAGRLVGFQNSERFLETLSRAGL